MQHSLLRNPTAFTWASRWIGVGSGFVLFVAVATATVLSAGPGTGRSHWSFQPVRDPAVPKTQDTAWPRSDLDAFVLHRLEAGGAKPLPPANKRTLIRRATFDLTGLPPEAADVEAFLADDSPQAFARVVDRLLGSPHYGEHWGRHWLDVVRYADTAGETADYPVPVAWRYRNYVIDSLNADKPYDDFLREQIAGDIIAGSSTRERYAECVTATGYLAVSRRFGFDSENYHHLTIQDTIDNLGQTVLGLSLGCARCHDHKYDPISMTDYYALYGIFDSSRYAFPGSEQKQKYRSMATLEPPAEAMAAWSRFDTRLYAMMRKLERNKLPVSGAVLRPLTDIDGDFEMQAPAAGGSTGVLVPPWIYEGSIAVTTDAQSPFRNLYPLGKVGASLPSGTNAYHFGQSILPRRTHEQGGIIHLNFDVRLAGTNALQRGRHRIWLGSRIVSEMSPPMESPAFELRLALSGVFLVETNAATQLVGRLEPGAWNNLQLVIDLGARRLSGRISTSSGSVLLPDSPFLATWNGVFNFLGVASESDVNPNTPAVDIDNIGLRDSSIPTPFGPTTQATLAEPTLATLSEKLQQTAGIDGDFELQIAGAAPDHPWHPGPRSAVQISERAQSSYQNIHPPGSFGIRLPGGSEYQGFGQTLGQPWKASETDTIYAALDFRCQPSIGEGSWRYYLGHGAGTSAAIELFINGREFVQRSGDSRRLVQTLRTNAWYQVQLTLHLKKKTYTGSITTPVGSERFEGVLATGWDGILDYTFIDSYGHIGGVRPELDADNFAVGTTPFRELGALSSADPSNGERRRTQVAALRRELASLRSELEGTRRELDAALSAGPTELTYAVVEGTPHNARIQLRGEPDKPGAEVPRGFPSALGGGPLPASASGSGRLELAQWLTRQENPLTARVMVNRIWQYHFGRGLVATPNDFGIRGQPPTHPELLDHLATRFQQCGWSIKAMHRLIMNSATYQQVCGDGSSADLDLYAGCNRRRLEAESLRDSILLVSGNLDRQRGLGHAFPAPTSWGFTQHGPFNAAYEHQKRSIYLMAPRIRRQPFLALFDGADPNSSTPTRSVSTVPTQALFFMNDRFVHDQSQQLARRLESVASTESEQVVLAYQLALGRPPLEIERTEAREFLAAYRIELGGMESPTAALAAFSRSLFGSNEFVHVD